MHDKRTIATDNPVRWYVSQSVSISARLSVRLRLRRAKTAEWIGVLFGVETVGAQGILC